MLLALIHAASGEQQAKRVPAAEIESALVTTVLGELGATTDDKGRGRRKQPSSPSVLSR
jgi:hypothetical protein